MLARLIVVAALFLAGCSLGPPADEVRAAVQAQLDAALDGRVLTVSRFTRAGSAPRRGEDGRIVYFNAELTLERDYDFTKWDAHNVASLAALVGAGPRGVVGLRDEGNRKGDTLGVYGSAAFRAAGAGWQQVALAPPAEDAPAPASVPAATVASVQPGPRELPPPSPLDQAMAAFAQLARSPTPPALAREDRDAILTEEATNATQRARRRLEQAEQRIVLAAGPSGGAYAETRAALRARAHAAHIPFDAADSEGSVTNLRILADRRAQFALVQNDVARSAHLGLGRFAAAAQADLRAVASLFPEPVHLITREGSGIAGPQDLRGKRVSLGVDGSGTRTNAQAVLAAHGLAPGVLGEAAALELAPALLALGEGRLDAVFATVHAPAAEVQRAFAVHRLALVPIGPAPALLDAGLVALTLPSRTYPRQAGPVPTVAAIALVVSRADVPDAQVDAMMGLLFERDEGAATAAVSRIGAGNARTGVGIPWHPRADARLAARPR